MISAASSDITNYDSANEAMATANTLLTVGAAPHSSGNNCVLYPDGLLWPYPHCRVYPDVHTHVTTPTQEQPHEVVQRAIREIAQAAHALQQSAEAMGVPVDEGALEKAIVTKLREAL